jgi:hypothetical protein
MNRGPVLWSRDRDPVVRKSGQGRVRRQVLAAVAVAGVLVSGCSSSGPASTTPSVSATPSAQKHSASATLPSYLRASQLRPCDSVSPEQLSSIIGKPVHIDRVGDIGQSPVLSSGPVLPKVWIATCNWLIPAYTDANLYLSVELAPDAAGARTDFDGMRTLMTITQSATHRAGYGQLAVFDIDKHGDVVIVIWQGAEVINFQFNSTSQPAPSAETRMMMAKAITKIIMRRYNGD